MKKTVSKWEIVWIVLSSIVGLTGIVLAILGIVADYLPVKASENFLSGSESYFEGIFRLSFTWAGAILVIAAALIAARARSPARSTPRPAFRKRKGHL